MDKQEKYDDDLLKTFLNPDRIEKAPAGFTSKTITRIQIEKQSSGLTRSFFGNKNRIPLVSFAVFAALIIISVALPATDINPSDSVIWSYLRNPVISLPSINNDFFQNLSIPGWIPYSFIGFVMLMFFDRILFGIFHKHGK
jgi:hypothetical protein